MRKVARGTFFCEYVAPVGKVHESAALPSSRTLSRLILGRLILGRQVLRLANTPSKNATDIRMEASGTINWTLGDWTGRDNIGKTEHRQTAHSN